MRVRTIGLKQTDEVVDLGERTLLYGPVGSGKSAVGEAIMLAVLGYVPRLGKRLLDTAALIRDKEAEVRLEFPDGKTVSRIFRYTSPGHLESNVECSWVESVKNAEHASAALQLFGADELEVSEALDIRQILNATPAQRAARLEQLLVTAGASTAERLTAVGRATIARLVKVEADRVPEDWKALQGLLLDPQKDAVKRAWPTLKAKLEDVDLSGTLTWVNAEKRRAATDSREGAAARKELDRRLGALPEVSEEARTELEALRSAEEQLLGSLAEQVKQARRDSADYKGLEEEVVEAQRTIGAAEAARQERPSTEDEEARLEEIGRELQRQGREPKAPEVQRKALAEIQTPLGAAMSKLSASEYDRRGAEETLKASKSSPWVEVLEIAEKLKTLAQSPAIDKLLQSLRRVALKYTVDPKKAAAELKAATATAERAQKAHRKLQDRRDKLAAQAAEKEAARDEFHGKRTALEKERTDLLARVNKVTERYAGMEATLQRAQQDLDAAQRRLSATEAPEDPEGLDAQRIDAESRLSVIKHDLYKLDQAKGAHAELDALSKDLARRAAERELYQALETSLQEIRAAELANATGLLPAVNEFLTAAYDGHEDHRRGFIQPDGNACRLGWIADGKHVLVQALSGGEWVLFAAALTAATLMLRKAPQRWLLIEAGETDDATLIRLLNGIGAVVGHLSGAIVMVPRHSWEDVLPATWEGCAVGPDDRRAPEREAVA